ncbi:MAG: hypothetical protein M3432_08865, partial [Chloroflexota bacterium]|nr:hypothetical protein [Chloroflexota bacterium]
MSRPPIDPPEEPGIDYPLVNEEGADAPTPLAQRMRDPRTIISIVLPLILIALVAVTVGNIDLS